MNDTVNRVEIFKDIFMEFVYVPAGEFWMGADEEDMEADSDEKPKHKVYLDAYWIGKFPVTQLEYAAYVQELWGWLPDHWNLDDLPPQISYLPRNYVRYHDALEFCRWMASMISRQVSIPTEAQWEKAARGTDGRKYPWGNQKPDRNFANYNLHIRDFTPVYAYPYGTSPYGCMDMAGNVYEWCFDWYSEDTYGSRKEWKNPTGPEQGQLRVQRGGSGFDGQYALRTSYRDSREPEIGDRFDGFRCVINES